MMTIGEYADMCGVKASTVRYYEKLGLLPEAVRRSGRRTYLDGDVPLLRLVVAARNAGFKIGELKAFTDLSKGGFRSNINRAARARADDIAVEIDQLTQTHSFLIAASACACSNINQCETLSGGASTSRRTMK